MKLWLKRIFLALGSTVLTLMVVEVVLRLAGIAPQRWAHSWHLEREDKRVGLDVYPDNPRGYFDVDLRDPQVRARWRQRGLVEVDRVAERTPFAVSFEYNQQLCRHATVGPKDPSTTRIIVIGDSFAEGQGVKTVDTFSDVLDRELEGQTEVINCGRRGHDFPMIREFFELQLALEPDIVVYAMVLNDPVQSAEFHARQRYLDDWILDRRRMYTEGAAATSFWQPRLWTLTKDRLEALRVGRETTRWYLDMYDEANHEGWEATQAYIEEMGVVMEARGGAFLVALLPLLVELDGEGERYPFSSLSHSIEVALEGRGVAFHDTTPAFLGHQAEELWVHQADRHPNERAHRMIADELRPVLQEIIGDLRAQQTSQ